MTMKPAELMARAHAAVSGLDYDSITRRSRNAYDNIAQAALTALAVAGYRVVPVKPTPHMISEGFEHIRMKEKWPECIAGIYRAMLAAEEE